MRTARGPHEAMRIFGYLRMPIFALIGGYVYALRPVVPGGGGSFLRGKARRILIPLLVVSTLFFVTQTTANGSWSGVNAESASQVYLHSYEIFWFLQAMLLIFLALPLLERAGLLRPVPLVAVALCVQMVVKPLEWISFLSLNGALFLLPFFLAGLALRRYRNAIYPWRGAILAVFLTSFALHALNVTLGGPIERIGRGTVLALLVGTSGPAAIVLFAPAMPPLARLGDQSYAIYLFHIFFVVALLRLFERLGLGNAVSGLVALGAGLIGPMVVERVARRWTPTRRLLLGLT